MSAEPDNGARSFALPNINGSGFALGHPSGNVSLCLMIGRSTFSIDAVSAAEARSLARAIVDAADFAGNAQPRRESIAARPIETASLHAFLNRVRSLFNIDGDQLPELEGGDWLSFRDDPVRYLMRAGETQAAAIWREVEKRQRAPVPA